MIFTCTMKLTAAGIPLYFAASHAVDKTIDYTFCFTFEKATITNDANGNYLATFNDGTVKTYPDPRFTGEGIKTFACLDAIKNGTKPVCTVNTTNPHVKLIEDIYHNIPITNFPEEEKVYEEERIIVPTLTDRLLKCYEKECMLSEV